MDSISPCVTKRLHLFRFACDMRRISIFRIAVRRTPLEVAVELDAVGGINVYALNLSAQTLALGETRHYLEGIAKNHPIRPVLVVLVELGLVYTLRDAIEVGEEIRRLLTGL